jgi:tetratricopeptide (TPR) repeat protein
LDAAGIEVANALMEDPDHITSNYISAVIALEKRNYVEASDRLDFVMKNSPDNAMAYYYKAVCLLENDGLNGTDTDLFRAAAGYSDDAEEWIAKQALENLQKALKLDSGLQPAKLLLVKLNLQDGKLGNARQYLNEILEGSPDDEQALLLQGVVKIMEGDFNGAKAVCEKVLENRPDSSQWLTRLGVVYAVSGETDHALDAFRRALALNPMQFDALQLMVELNLAAGRFNEAVELCNLHGEKIAENPAAVATVDNMAGHIYLSGGQREMAIGKFEKAIQSVPTFLAPRMTIAHLEAAEGRYEAAVSRLEEVLSINGNYLPACMALGDISYVRGDRTGAEKYYRKALKIENGYGQAANNLAYILSMYDNKLTEALSLAQTAVKKLPASAAARDTLGWIHYKMGNTYKAVSEIEESLSLDPDYALANYHMGLLCYKNREFVKARDYVKRALEIDPDFEDAEDAREMLDM